MEAGIDNRRTMPYNPQQNECTEGMNSILLRMCRCILVHSGVPPEFWEKAALGAEISCK